MPTITIPASPEELLCNRWIYPDKPFKLQKLYASMPLPKNFMVPQIKEIGEVSSQGQRYSYWVEDYVKGESLTEKTLQETANTYYLPLISFLVELHTLALRPEALREYYTNRLTAAEEVLGKDHFYRYLLDSESYEKLTVLLAIAKEELPHVVSVDERVTTVHGDFRGANILLDADKIGIIDFEQGVNGGDWFVDLEKLLRFTSELLPSREYPNAYRPPLAAKTKLELLSFYLDARGNEHPFFRHDLETEPQDRERVIEQRANLIQLDNTISSLVVQKILYEQNENADSKTKHLEALHKLASQIMKLQI